jgi:hypothetical protein
MRPLYLDTNYELVAKYPLGGGMCDKLNIASFVLFPFPEAVGNFNYGGSLNSSSLTQRVLGPTETFTAGRYIIRNNRKNNQRIDEIITFYTNFPSTTNANGVTLTEAVAFHERWGQGTIQIVLRNYVVRGGQSFLGQFTTSMVWSPYLDVSQLVA